jgi:hypothetical protein
VLRLRCRKEICLMLRGKWLEDKFIELRKGNKLLYLLLRGDHTPHHLETRAVP